MGKGKGQHGTDVEYKEGMIQRICSKEFGKVRKLAHTKTADQKSSHVSAPSPFTAAGIDFNPLLKGVTLL